MYNITQAQLDTLSPDVATIIKQMNYENEYITNLKKMKSYVMYVDTYDANYEKVSKMSKLDNLLKKYKHVTFYWYNQNGKQLLLTQDELINFIPNGVDINKITYSGGKYPNVTISKPREYCQKYIDDIIHPLSVAYTNNNFKVIDDRLLKLAKYFLF